MPWTPSGFNVKLFRFAYGLNKPTYGVIFWAVTVVNSPREMKNVRMAVGSNSASMWWLNGKEAVLLSGDRRMVMDDCVSKRLTLNKGRNVIRGAVINGPGLSDFCVRFIDENGKPITDLTLNLEQRRESVSHPMRGLDRPLPGASMKRHLLVAAVAALAAARSRAALPPSPVRPRRSTANPTSTIRRPSRSATASTTPSAPAAEA